MIGKYLEKLKSYEDKALTVWGSTTRIAAELGSFEDKNLFSRVDVGVKVFREVRSLYGKLNNKVLTPYIDKWYSGKTIDYMLDKIIQNMSWNNEFTKQEKTSEDFDVTTREADNFQIITIRSVARPETKYCIRLLGDEHAFYKHVGKHIIKEFGQVVNLNLRSMDENYGFSKCTRDLNFDTLIIRDLEFGFRKYIEQKIGRNIMLYGPPGTGKTSIAYSLANRLGQTLIIKNLSAKLSDICVTFLNIIDPAVVIIDDIDRIKDLDEVLTQLEEIKAAGRLVIATANKIDKLDSAVLRPGRFDKLIKIDTAVPELIMSLVHNDEEIFELVKTWSVACIVELMTRIQVEGKEHALANMEDLIERDKKIKEEYKKL